MDKDIAIEVKNVSKKFNISHQRGRLVSLREKVNCALKHPIKALKQLDNKKEEFWALRDINFMVEKGDCLGIIGANGSGKSTLLKLISEVTQLSGGEIKITGRVASLLEVGAGFHSELTGRENIFFSGAILGMTKKEIVKKFNQIVEFSGVEKFLDMPAKHYSSGMYVRLAFAVAAHVEPDILILDEVLAVGDDEFQKKCLAKINRIIKEEGRTILFVSHNLNMVKSLCNKVIELKEGKIIFNDVVDKMIDN